MTSTFINVMHALLSMCMATLQGVELKGNNKLLLTVIGSC